MSYDPAKRQKNRRKHAIDLAECEAVLDAPMLTREDTREDYGELTCPAIFGPFET